MATYQYTCENTDCEVQQKEMMFEVTQRMSDDALTTCPECKNETLRRVIEPAGGWRIGGVLNSTSMYNVSGDPGPRRKGYDCDPTN